MTIPVRERGQRAIEKGQGLFNSRVDPESLSRNELVKVLVIGPGKLVTKVLVGKPDLARTDTAFDNEPVKVALSIIDHGNPTDFLKGFLAFPK